MIKKSSVFRLPQPVIGGIWVAFIVTAFVLLIAASVAYSSPWVLLPIGLVWTSLGVGMHAGLKNVNAVSRHIRKHMRISKAGQGVSVFHDMRARDRVNLQRALTHLHQADVGTYPLFGAIARTYMINPMDPPVSGVAYIIAANAPPTNVQWDQLPSSVTEKTSCARNALYLLHVDGQPYCALIVPPPDQFRPVYQLEIFACSAEIAKAALALILKTADGLNAFRGSFITLENPAYFEDKFDVHFHELPTVRREEVILPDALLRIIERNTLFFLSQQAALRKAGQRTQRGLLFYGPPGTGKTLVAKYLASAGRSTIIILSATNMHLIHEACQYARLLAPSMVVLEDVDLVAQNREEVINNTVLHQIMESMDGLGPQSDCLFILTTNRPESLEKALASRPGRVDQAIHFPLPEVEERRRLFALFAQGLDLSGVNLEPLLDRTKGSTPAFIQELIRKAALLALERDEAFTPLQLRDVDFSQALREIALFGGDFTQRILGFKVARDTDSPFG